VKLETYVSTSTTIHPGTRYTRDVRKHPVDLHLLVHKLAKHYHLAPDQLSDEQVKVFLQYLVQERKLAPKPSIRPAVRCAAFISSSSAGLWRKSNWHAPLFARPRADRKSSSSRRWSAF
jgi:hypothetical protein